MEEPDKKYFDFRFTSIETRLTQLEKDNRELLDSKAMLEGKADRSSFYISFALSICALVVALIRLLK